MIARPLVTAVLLLLSSPVLAQGMPGGGGGGAPPGGPGEGGGPGGDRPPRPPRMVSIERDALDDAATAMFREIDTDRNGKATLAELHAIEAGQRAQIVADRFRAIDADGNGAINIAEFDAWQQRLGTAAREDSASLVYDYVAAPDVIGPPTGDSPKDRLLVALIQPFNTHNLVAANVDYDDGVTLDEWLRFQRAPFDAADLDGDGELGGEEIRMLRGARECGPVGGGGAPPSGPAAECGRPPAGGAR